MIDEPNFNLKDIEKEAILKCLKWHEGHRTNTCKSLGISTRCLRLKLHKWGLNNLY